MAAPPKPWERPAVNRQMDESPTSSFMSGSSSTAGLPTSLSMAGPMIGGGDAPPPVPSRPTQTGYSGYSPGTYGYGGGYSSPYGGGGMYSSPYSSMYGGYGSSMYGGYGGSYGGYGMNRYGYGGQNDYNSFSRMAEESSRPAFQSIESIVGAFSSVSMMLDSTFQAVYNSFRAVIGVADNFSRMKMQFAQIFATLAVFRYLKYLYRKLLVLLRLRPPGFAEDAWAQAGDTVAQATAGQGPGKGKSSWPVLMFFAIIMGGPWLIWKFLQSAFSGEGSSLGWANGSEDHFVARALYNFQGENTNELSFQAGANLQVAPKELQPRVKGWLLASVDGKKVGLIPANYVKVLGKRRGTKESNYPVQNELDSMSSPPQNIVPNSDTLQPASLNSMNNQVPTLSQTQSAVNFEQQFQAGFASESNFPETMDTSFQQPSESLLDSVPEIPLTDQDKENKTSGES